MAYDERVLMRALAEPTTQRKAFEQLVRQYSEQLYWKIRRIVLVHDDADDVLQNTFVKAWINLSDFRGQSRISTWLYRIAINQSLTFLNKQKAQQSVSMDDEEVSVANQLEGDPYFDGDKAQRLLQQALTTLPEKQRLVFNLRYFDELTYTEIIGSTVGALKADYHLAVKKISKYFEVTD